MSLLLALMVGLFDNLYPKIEAQFRRMLLGQWLDCTSTKREASTSFVEGSLNAGKSRHMALNKVFITFLQPHKYSKLQAMTSNRM
ncbi:hypothetical protein D5086_012800 [Populus alba]|uniref:Uncharacterized protein n=1 Tax=Populus alba TaxID=43335 RepID=A0ACC4C4S6_POPAL